MLSGLAGEVVAAGALGLPVPAETGTTFLENALLKARAAVAATACPALADDSGLCVTALDGAPGVYSADWEGAERNAMLAMTRLQTALGTSHDRSAHFVCVLVLAWPDGEYITVDSRCDGQIVWPPRGTNGHGFDPVFLPDGYEQTFGQMTTAQKNAISHRRRAFDKLRQMLEK